MHVQEDSSQHKPGEGIGTKRMIGETMIATAAVVAVVTVRDGETK